jgi:hypothetical protein
VAGRGKKSMFKKKGSFDFQSSLHGSVNIVYDEQEGLVNNSKQPDSSYINTGSSDSTMVFQSFAAKKSITLQRSMVSYSKD